MTRSIWATAAALIIAAAVAIPVIAQPPQGRGGPGGPMGPGGFGGRGGFPMLHTLDLTDAQREQIRTITRQQRDATDSPGQKLADTPEAAAPGDSRGLAGHPEDRRAEDRHRGGRRRGVDVADSTSRAASPRC